MPRPRERACSRGAGQWARRGDAHCLCCDCELQGEAAMGSGGGGSWGRGGVRADSDWGPGPFGSRNLPVWGAASLVSSPLSVAVPGFCWRGPGPLVTKILTSPLSGGPTPWVAAKGVALLLQGSCDEPLLQDVRRHVPQQSGSPSGVPGEEPCDTLHTRCSALTVNCGPVFGESLRSRLQPWVF